MTVRLIPNKFIPIRFPLFQTVCWITILHYWEVPQWAWGIFATLAAVVWGIWFLVIFTAEYISAPPFEKEKSR